MDAKDQVDYARPVKDRCGAPHPSNGLPHSGRPIHCTRRPHEDTEHNYRNDWSSSPRYEWRG